MKKCFFLLLLAISINLFSQENEPNLKKTFSLTGGVKFPGIPPSITLLSGLAYGNQRGSFGISTGYSFAQIKLSGKGMKSHQIPIMIHQSLNEVNKEDGMRIGVIEM